MVLGRRKLWGIYFGHFAWGTTSTFFLTWFPTYLVNYRHFTSSRPASTPPCRSWRRSAACCVRALISDALVRRGFSLGFARKTPIIGGLAISTSIVGANYVESQPMIILFLSVAFFANGMASIHWSLVSARRRNG